MANSNFTPLGANVRWSRDDGLVQGGQQQPSSSASAAASGLFNASSLSDPFSNYGSLSSQYYSIFYLYF
jgi:hypothetical protein